MLASFIVSLKLLFGAADHDRFRFDVVPTTRSLTLTTHGTPHGGGEGVDGMWRPTTVSLDLFLIGLVLSY